MMDENRFAGKYRTQTTRLQSWNYSNPGYYFVTICTKDRRNWFGDFVNDEMKLSKIGEIINNEWKKTAEIRPYVTLDTYIIMPNHFHGIIFIEESSGVETPSHGVSTSSRSMHHQPRWKARSLSSIIQQFKAACTKHIHEKGFSEFSWQSRFYDYIIRSENETIRIRKYLNSNPVRWNQKELFAEDL